jgi:hypothetical protein
VPRGRSAASEWTVRQTPHSQKQLAKRIEMKTLKNTRRTRRTLGQLAPHGLSVPTRRTIRQVRIDAGAAGREQKRKLSTTYPSMDLPNVLSS